MEDIASELQSAKTKKPPKQPNSGRGTPSSPTSNDEPKELLHSVKHAAQAPPLIAPLQKAVGILMKVHPLLAKAAHDCASSPVAREDEISTVPPLGKDAATVVPRSLDRLRVVRRTLDEALEVAEATGEDALIEATLRQHERALNAREQADAHIEQERRNVQGVRWDVIELERSMLRSQCTHRRLGVDGSAQRFGEFERQCKNIEGVHGYLTNDLRTITDSLITQLRKNGDIDESMAQICQARDVAMEENAKANQLLASGETLEVYRKAKEREKIVADTDLAQAQAQCQAEIARLREGWSATEAMYKAEMLELRTQVRSMQQRLDENSREAEKALSKQSSEWGRCSEDMGKQITYGVKALEDLRMEKAQNLHRELQRSRQRERDLAASTQRRLEVQLNEVKFQCKNKLKMEELRLGEEVKSDRRSVESAKKKALLFGISGLRACARHTGPMPTRVGPICWQWTPSPAMKSVASGHPEVLPVDNISP